MEEPLQLRVLRAMSPELDSAEKLAAVLDADVPTVAQALHALVGHGDVEVVDGRHVRTCNGTLLVHLDPTRALPPTAAARLSPRPAPQPHSRLQAALAAHPTPPVAMAPPGSAQEPGRRRVESGERSRLFAWGITMLLCGPLLLLGAVLGAGDDSSARVHLLGLFMVGALTPTVIGVTIWALRKPRSTALTQIPV